MRVMELFNASTTLLQSWKSAYLAYVFGFVGVCVTGMLNVLYVQNIFLGLYVHPSYSDVTSDWRNWNVYDEYPMNFWLRMQAYENTPTYVDVIPYRWLHIYQIKCFCVLLHEWPSV